MKDKVIKLIEKIKGIFTSKTMKKKNAEVAELTKGVTGTIEVHDTNSLEKLRKECKKDLKNGKDPEKVKAKWKKGLAILGFVAAGAAVAGGVAAGVKHHKKKKIPVSQAVNLLEDNSKKMNVAQIEMKDTIKLLEGPTMQPKESHASARKRGVELGTDTHGKGVVQMGMNKLALPDKSANVAARVNAETEIHSDYSKALLVVNNDVYKSSKESYASARKRGVELGVDTHGKEVIHLPDKLGNRMNDIKISIKTLESTLKKQNQQLNSMKGQMGRNKGHGTKQMRNNIQNLEKQIKENKELLAGYHTSLNKIKSRVGMESVSSDFEYVVDIMLEHVSKLYYAADVMLEKADVLLESVYDEYSFDDDIFAESYDDYDDIFDESYDDIFAESYDDYDDIFDDDYLF